MTRGKLIQGYDFRNSPENEKIMTDLGLLYLRMGETNQAIQQFETALSNSSGCTNALLPLGFIKQVFTIFLQTFCQVINYTKFKSEAIQL